ncbi:MAG: hypothetical protein IKN26_01670, partial [Eubacterium sp.]|nr:hypothetical protein [Eubacterium sp.]
AAHPTIVVKVTKTVGTTIGRPKNNLKCKMQNAKFRAGHPHPIVFGQLKLATRNSIIVRAKRVTEIRHSSLVIRNFICPSVW